MEHLALWILFGSSVIIYGVWASMVIDGFCRFLGISCLVIPTATTTTTSSSGKIWTTILVRVSDHFFHS